MSRIRYITIVYHLLLCLMAGCFFGCQTGSEEQSVSVHIKRYDKVLASYVLHHDTAAFRQMEQTYPRETKTLVENVLSLGKMSNPQIGERIYHYYNDRHVRQMSLDVLQHFKNLDSVEDSLEKAFSKLQVLLPGFRVPVLYTQIAGLNQSIVVNDSLVGISLDKYLGEDYPLYADYYYPNERKTMVASRIVPDVLFFYLCSEYSLKYDSSVFAEKMVNIGKIYWIVYKIIGYPALSDAMGFTKEDSEWMKDNESKAWYYLMSNNVVRSSSSDIHDYMEGDYLKNSFHTNVPAFMPMWMGARLVENFMNKHKDMSYRQLLQSDYKTIFADNGFTI